MHLTGSVPMENPTVPFSVLFCSLAVWLEVLQDDRAT